MSLASDDASPLPRWSLAALTVILALGALLRWGPVRESLWIDELHTAWCVSGSLAEVGPRAMAGNQSPVFFWLEWLLTRLFGHSELIFRLPSLIAGSLLPLALFLLAVRWTRSAGVALVAAMLAAVDPRLIFDATEARPYALLELLAIVHVALFARLIAQPTWRLRVAFILLAALLFHLHYTAALLLPAELAFWMLVRRFDPEATPYRLPQLALDLFFLAALMTPALGQVLAIAERRHNWAAFIPDQPAFALLRIFFWGGALIFVGVDPDAFLRSAWPPGKLTVPRQTLLRLEQPLLLTLCWLLVPLAIAWLLNATNIARLFYPRYLLVCAPAAILLAALCTRLPRAPAARLLLALALVAIAVGVQENNIVQQFRRDGRAIDDRREDWRSAIAWLDVRQIDEPGPVFLASALIEADALRAPHSPLLDDYCLLPLHTRIYPLPLERGNQLPLPYSRPGLLDAEARQRIAERGGAWLVVRGSTRSAKRLLNNAVTSLRSAPGGLTRHWELAENQSFGNVHVLRLSELSDPNKNRPAQKGRPAINRQAN